MRGQCARPYTRTVSHWVHYASRWVCGQLNRLCVIASVRGRTQGRNAGHTQRKAGLNETECSDQTSTNGYDPVSATHTLSPCIRTQSAQVWSSHSGDLTQFNVLSRLTPCRANLRSTLRPGAHSASFNALLILNNEPLDWYKNIV